ncbi:MAG: substrate-binding domain-containing protein [Methylococcales bacterium]|jgi:tungstate transport system substrate-binding protein|nr:tungsten ABC transporter substrate-binding protein [Methylococcaceae bacterium]
MRLNKLLFTLSFIFISLNTQAENILRLATTTSTENSGLLSVLHPIFEERFNCQLHVLAVGTGKALKLAENGDVDIVLVHAPNAELAFINEGLGINRTPVMHNDFILVGPPQDLAQVKQAKSIIHALHNIAATQSQFISRGDDSGTHKKENALWQTADINPVGVWYVQSGQGMGAVLKMANEKQAYTLTDRGTYLAFQSKLDLTILFEKEPPLLNPYHIMVVNPARQPHVKYELAQHYIDFVTGSEGQNIIASYKMAGQTLFYPDVIKQ